MIELESLGGMRRNQPNGILFVGRHADGSASFAKVVEVLEQLGNFFRLGNGFLFPSAHKLTYRLDGSGVCIETKAANDGFEGC